MKLAEHAAKMLAALHSDVFFGPLARLVTLHDLPKDLAEYRAEIREARPDWKPFLPVSFAVDAKLALLYVADEESDWSDDTVLFVVCHELMHILLAHDMRVMAESMPNRQVLNAAMDMHLHVFLEDIKPRLFGVPYSWQDLSIPKAQGCFWDKPEINIRDWALKQVYDDLMARPKPPNACDLVESGSGSPDGSVPGPGDMSPLVQEARRRAVEIVRREAAIKAKGYLPAGMVIEIEPEQVAKVDYAGLVRDHITSMKGLIETANDWRKPSRRSSEFLLPSQSMYGIDCTVVVDSSGSMSDYVKLLVAEINKAVQTFGVETEVLLCDGNVYKYRFDNNIIGMGGSDMSAAFKAATKDLIVFITDGHIEYPTHEDKEVFWVVLDNRDFTPRYGDVLHVCTS